MATDTRPSCSGLVTSFHVHHPQSASFRLQVHGRTAKPDAPFLPIGHRMRDDQFGVFVGGLSAVLDPHFDERASSFTRVWIRLSSKLCYLVLYSIGVVSRDVLELRTTATQ